MFKNNTKYNKVYRNGILYNKAFRNGQQILGNPVPVDPSLLLNIPFNGDIENKVVGGIQMEVAGGAPTFSNGAAIFNGSQSIKTVTPLNIGTDKVTVCFWLKTMQATVGCIMAKLDEINYTDGFYSYVSAHEADRVSIVDFKNGIPNYGASQTVINDNVWRYIAITIDRSLAGSEQTRIYVNGLIDYVPKDSPDLNGDFITDRVFIGSSPKNLDFFTGSLKDFKFFNRVLTQQEIQGLMV